MSGFRRHGHVCFAAFALHWSRTGHEREVFASGYGVKAGEDHECRSAGEKCGEGVGEAGSGDMRIAGHRANLGNLTAPPCPCEADLSDVDRKWRYRRGGLPRDPSRRVCCSCQKRWKRKRPCRLVSQYAGETSFFGPPLHPPLEKIGWCTLEIHRAFRQKPPKFWSG